MPTTTRGRPFDAAVDQAIVDAAYELLIEVGFNDLTIQEVAVRAEVGKPAIYRRYANKVELCIAAVLSQPGFATVPDTGDVQSDFLALAQISNTSAGSRAWTRITGAMLAESSDSEMTGAFRDVIKQRRGFWRIILQRGIDRGELRDDLNIETIIDAASGAWYSRTLLGKSTSRKWAEDLLDTLWPTMAA